MKFLIFLIVPIYLLSSMVEKNCKLSTYIPYVSVSKPSMNIGDIKRNLNTLTKMCMYELTVKEGKYNWKMLLVYNPNKKNGPFWFLPHDNENTAFDAATYAISKYGGGFLSILSDNKRHHKGQDPNRNFSNKASKDRSCRQQRNASPKYTQAVFSIINKYKGQYPVLALHNNADSWHGGNGSGGVSILISSRSVRSYPAHKNIDSSSKGLKDEDNLVYIAGKSKTPPQDTLNSLLSKGMHVKYEIVNSSNNDCSLSNHVVLSSPNTDYYNIETEHGDLTSQKIMIDKLMQHLKRLK